MSGTLRNLFVRFYEREFSSFCESGRCLRGNQPNKNCRHESRRTECYEKYVDVQVKRATAPRTPIKQSGRSQDPRWQKLKRQVSIRDEGKCQLSGLLTPDDWATIETEFKREFMMFIDSLDGAHIFPAGSYPEIMYEEWNVVLIGRFFHQRLDMLRHPVTNKPISSRERLQWLLYARDKIWYVL